MITILFTTEFGDIRDAREKSRKLGGDIDNLVSVNEKGEPIMGKGKSYIVQVEIEEENVTTILKRAEKHNITIINLRNEADASRYQPVGDSSNNLLSGLYEGGEEE